MGYNNDMGIFKRKEELKESTSLVRHVKMEVKPFYSNYYNKHNFKYFKRELSKPSAISILLVACSWVIIFLGSLYLTPIFLSVFRDLPPIFQNLNSIEEIHQQANNILAILGILSTVVFGLLIYIVEAGRDGRKSERLKGITISLLEDSEVWVVVETLIISLLPFIYIRIFDVFGGTTLSFSIILLLLILMTVYVIFKTLTISVDSQWIQDHILKNISDEAIQYLRDQTENKVKKNKFYEIFSSENLFLKLNIGSIENIGQYYAFELSKYGYIEDINVKGLFALGEYIEKIARENNISFSAAPNLEINRNKKLIGKETFKVNNERLLRIFPSKEIKGGDSSVLYLHKDIFGGNLRLKEKGEIEARLNRIIKINPQKDNRDKRLQENIYSLRKEVFDAIEERRDHDIEEYVWFYRDLIGKFLVYLRDSGIGNYNLENANKEMGFGGGWKYVDYIEESISFLFIEGMKSDNYDVYSDIIYLPFLIVIEAVEYGDSYIFNKFARFASKLYSASEDIKNKKKRKYCQDRSTRYLREVADFYISAKLKEVQEKDLDNWKDLAISMIKQFQNLLKLIYDKGDKKNFSKTLEQTNKLYEFFIEDNYLHVYPKDKKNPRFTVARTLHERKEELFLGFASMVFDREKISGSNQYFKMFGNYLPKDIKELTKVFLRTKGMKNEDFWDWDWWDLKEEEVVEIKTQEKIDVLYAVQALYILSKHPSLNIENIDISCSDKFRYIFENTGNIMQTLKSIEEDFSQWEPFLDKDSVKQIPKFKDFIKKTKNSYLEKEEKYIISKKISSKKIIDFKNDAEEHFWKSFEFKPILSEYGNYKVFREENPKGTIGVNQFIEKEAFFDNWHVQYMDLGENYGGAIGRGVDTRIADALIKNSKSRKDLEAYIQNGYLSEKPLFAIALNVLNFELNKLLKEFTPSYQNLPITGYIESKNHKVPVYDVFTEKRKPKGLMFFNDKQLGDFNLYVDKNRAGKDVLDITIKPFDSNDKEYKNLLKNSPEWLKGKSKKEITKYLEKHVITEAYISYSFQANTDNKPIFFPIEESI